MRRYLDLCKAIVARGGRPGDATLLLLLEFKNAVEHGYKSREMIEDEATPRPAEEDRRRG
jgi:hypothetical protein